MLIKWKTTITSCTLLYKLAFLLYYWKKGYSIQKAVHNNNKTRTDCSPMLTMKITVLSSNLAWKMVLVMSCMTLVDARCTFFHRLLLGQIKYATSPGFPTSYGQNTRCLWQYESEPGTRIVVACEQMHLPQTRGCYEDHLVVSLTGDPSFRYNQGATRRHCGNSTFVYRSQGNRLALGLASTSISRGGSFFCSTTEISNITVSTKKDVAKCDCGRTNSTIRQIDGRNKTYTTYPFMVGIFHTEWDQVYCGATIISDRYVLTAAHCVRNKNIKLISVNIGGGGHGKNSVLHAIRSYKTHPEFSSRNSENDIAIVEVWRAFMFSSTLGPICLPIRYTHWNFEGQPVKALSWSKRNSNPLKVVGLTVISKEECASEYGVNISRKQLCTSFQGKKSCHNGSGGPILWYDTVAKRTFLLGIISSEKRCSGIDTRVTSYISWVVKNTKNTGFCV